jgi:hypothetical protein
MLRAVILSMALMTVQPASAGCFLFFCVHHYHHHMRYSHHAHRYWRHVYVIHRRVVVHRNVTVVKKVIVQKHVGPLPPIQPVK